jgi:hypothetical protein
MAAALWRQEIALINDSRAAPATPDESDLPDESETMEKQ